MRAVTLLVAGALMTPAATAGQMPGMLAPDPDAPRKDGFDLGRAIFWEAPNFIPMRNPDWIPLHDARRAGSIDDDTPVVVFDAGGTTLVLVSSQMAYHHVAQGEMNGEPWMVTF